MESTKTAGSQTSASVGAMLKSPMSANGLLPAASAATAPFSAASQRSLYA